MKNPNQLRLERNDKMKLNFNFDGKTFLSKWWKIVRDNFTAIQTDHNTLSNKLDTEIKARESAESSLSSRINNEVTIRQAADNELQRNIDSEITERQTADSKKADKTELYGTDETTKHTVTYSLTAADMAVSIDAGHSTGTVTVSGNTVKSKILLDGYSIQASELSAPFFCGKGEDGDKYICIYYSPETGTLTMTVEDVETAPEAGTIALMMVGYNTATVTTMYNRAQTFTGINNLNGLKTNNKNSFLAAVNEIFATAKTASDTANTAQKNANDAVVDTSTLQGEFDEHERSQNNPHNVTAEQVGLGNVDNTSDVDKPISTAAAKAIQAAYDLANNEISERKAADKELQKRIEYEKVEREADLGDNNMKFFKKADKTELYGSEKDVAHTITHKLEKSDLSIRINTTTGKGTVYISMSTVQTKIFRDGHAYIPAKYLETTFSAEDGEMWVNLQYDSDEGELYLSVDEQPYRDIGYAPIAKMNVTNTTAVITEMYTESIEYEGLNTLDALKTTNKDSFIGAINEIVDGKVGSNEMLTGVEKSYSVSDLLKWLVVGMEQCEGINYPGFDCLFGDVKEMWDAFSSCGFSGPLDAIQAIAELQEKVNGK